MFHNKNTVYMVPGRAMVFSSRQGHRLQFEAGTWSSVPGRVIVFSSRQGHRLQFQAGSSSSVPGRDMVFSSRQGHRLQFQAGSQFQAGPWSSAWCSVPGRAIVFSMVFSSWQGHGHQHYITNCVVWSDIRWRVITVWPTCSLTMQLPRTTWHSIP